MRRNRRWLNISIVCIQRQTKERIYILGDIAIDILKITVKKIILSLSWNKEEVIYKEIKQLLENEEEYREMSHAVNPCMMTTLQVNR